MRRLCVKLRWSFWDLWDLLVTEWARVRLPGQRIVPPDWPSKVLVTVRGIQNDGGKGDDVLPSRPCRAAEPGSVVVSRLSLFREVQPCGVWVAGGDSEASLHSGTGRSSCEGAGSRQPPGTVSAGRCQALWTRSRDVRRTWVPVWDFSSRPSLLGQFLISAEVPCCPRPLSHRTKQRVLVVTLSSVGPRECFLLSASFLIIKQKG